MYPYEIFLGMDLYSILMAVGVIACMIFIRLQSDWRGLKAKLQNFYLINAVVAVVLGYGGLIGGTAMFIIIYFAVGHFLFKDKYHLPHLRTASDIAPACITVAHGFGRLGCLMAGCCYGARCDAWYGIKMVHLGYKVVPVQLFEALYLFGLSIIFLVMFKKGKKYLMPAYMMAYAVWRFVAEILRNDYRGATVVDFLTPSQFISVLLLAGGLLLLGIEMYVDHRKTKAAVAEAPAPVGDGEAPAEAAETAAAETAEGEAHE